jgi:hypothetical protein
MRNMMLALLAAGAVCGGLSSPAAAFDYPYCLQSRDAGIPGDCQYRSYAECTTTASGRHAWCAINPRVAFAQQQRKYRRHPQY